MSLLVTGTLVLMVKKGAIHRVDHDDRLRAH